ncbi:hypothetical protein AAZX31_19G129900 [Glycine max]
MGSKFWYEQPRQQFPWTIRRRRGSSKGIYMILKA